MSAVVRIGILSFAHMHATSYANLINRREDTELVGIADENPERGREMAEAFGTVYYDSISGLLDQKLDGVVVNSENANHRRMVEQAAASGVKAILCEKPIATTVADAQAMIDACAARGVKLATAFPCRYSAPFIRLQDQIESGMLGDTLSIRGTNRGSMPGGWFIDKELSGGGAVIDHTVHVADLCRRLLNREAKEVYAEIGSGFYHQEWDDTGFLTIAYDGGVFASIDTSWSRPKTYPTWGDVTLQVVGTKGVIDLDMFAQNLNHYDDKNNRASWVNWGSGMDEGMVSDFIGLIRGEPVPRLATGEDGLHALAVAEAAYASAEAGQPILVGV